MGQDKLTLETLERFLPEKMAKLDLFQSARLLLGLNCLEAGQSQPAHSHENADKFYFVVRGQAEFTVGGSTVEASAGELVLCPAGTPHGIKRAFVRTTILVGIAPWQPSKRLGLARK
jgi:quercetin dioxygenase-like cupin family protein